MVKIGLLLHVFTLHLYICTLHAIILLHLVLLSFPLLQIHACWHYDTEFIGRPHAHHNVSLLHKLSYPCQRFDITVLCDKAIVGGKLRFDVVCYLFRSGIHV